MRGESGICLGRESSEQLIAITHTQSKNLNAVFRRAEYVIVAKAKTDR